MMRALIRLKFVGLASLAGVCLALSTALAEEAATKQPFRVLTTFTVIQDIAQNVAGTAAIVESITKPGAEIHDYQPTPLDIVKAQSADLVLYNGFNLERWFERFFENVQDVPSVVVTDGIEPMGINEGPYTGKPNPHAWMSPANALLYIENIRKALVCTIPPTPMPTIAMQQPMRPRFAPWTSRCASGCRPCPRTAAGWFRARGRSATWPATTRCGKRFSGPSTRTSRARPSRSDA